MSAPSRPRSAVALRMPWDSAAVSCIYAYPAVASFVAAVAQTAGAAGRRESRGEKGDQESGTKRLEKRIVSWPRGRRGVGRGPRPLREDGYNL